jgi:hypothetical protein
LPREFPAVPKRPSLPPRSLLRALAEPLPVPGLPPSGALIRPIMTPAPSAKATPPALQIHWDFFGFIRGVNDSEAAMFSGKMRRVVFV